MKEFDCKISNTTCGYFFGESLDNRRENAAGNRVRQAILTSPPVRVGEELNVLYARSQLVKTIFPRRMIASA